MTEVSASPAPDNSAPFQHLHPFSIILKSAGTLGQNLVAILVLHFSMFDQNFLYTGLAAAVLIALVVGVTALIWSRFTYQVTAREIRIRSGLLNRNNRSIPFDRIQDVSLEQKLTQKACVTRFATIRRVWRPATGKHRQAPSPMIARRCLPWTIAVS